MKRYLMDTFRFNDWANTKVLDAMRQLDDTQETTAVFSHIITAQNKWLLRVNADPAEAEVKWWDTPFEFDDLGERWSASLNDWLEHLVPLGDADLGRKIAYVPGPGDNGDSQLLRDVVLQLNYHAILHRAEIGLRLRDQGFEPPHLDYIYYLPPDNKEYRSAVAA